MKTRVKKNNSRYISPSDPAWYPRSCCRRVAPTTFLYVAYCEGFAKVGISHNPKNRIHNMEGESPFHIKLVLFIHMSIDDGRQAEIDLCKKLSDYHWRGEWFKCTKQRAVNAAKKIAAKYPVAEGDSVTRYILPYRIKAVPRARLYTTPEGQFYGRHAIAAFYGITIGSVSERVANAKFRWSSTTLTREEHEQMKTNPLPPVLPPGAIA